MSQGPAPEDLLLVGQITVPHGIRGQVKLRAITSYPEHLDRVKTVYLGEERTPYRLQRAAVHKPQIMIITLGGVTTRTAAEALRGQEVYIRAEDARPLEPDEYFLHDLPGLHVETEQGVAIGVVREVIETGANEVLVVTRAEGGDALIPMIRDVVIQLDIAAGRIVIRPMPGLL
ncbi:ribosome maturation factor RimM [Kallotenue papyrolyticum]|uniref:ribosome maturation factor RimM n=1 Tax=Kallotenue papyrolyticum TaxID=1325125 RepID=UPI0004928464|nr:ribosome maturation factor RimM [Kallotenue papyrolyticum]